jgi:hypothetical protein
VLLKLLPEDGRERPKHVAIKIYKTYQLLRMTVPSTLYPINIDTKRNRMQNTRIKITNLCLSHWRIVLLINLEYWKTLHSLRNSGTIHNCHQPESKSIRYTCCRSPRAPHVLPTTKSPSSVFTTIHDSHFRNVHNESWDNFNSLAYLMVSENNVKLIKFLAK